MNNWIFIRGWGRGVAHWASFLEDVQAAFPQDQFEFLEIPGNGARHLDTSPLTIAEFVRQMRKQSDFVRSGKNFRLVGISLGGMIACEWARLWPKEVELLCLINSSSANHGRIYERLLFNNLPKMLKIGREKDIAVRELSALEICANSEERRKFVLPSWIEEATLHPVRRQNLVRQLFAASHFRFPQRPPVKTVLFGSTKDRLVSVKCTERLAEQWGCPLHLHPWAGHDLPLDDPEWMIDCLKKMQ